MAVLNFNSETVSWPNKEKNFTCIVNNIMLFELS